ncbi:DgsA anti-repressor MtfA [Brenneria roseae subsp. roseae]|uniref:DgsA anti-repressor MtfA n=1 Tax=Brenneria roseae TaxID=1509241 RepID=UPI000D60D8FA|nr:DgsA anti-repressor MtfA [Brenneria roseae]PWC16202.1 DgsA anti-repressor MtfA [Brenneria roseae subsp. roseae]
MIKWPWKTNECPMETLEHWQPAMSIPLLAPLSDAERKKLVPIAEQFLKIKRLIPLQELVLTEVMQQRIALLFSLPVLELGIEYLDGFHEVLIYPGPFIVNDEWQDDIGLVHTGKIVQSGQSWDQGPVILNWQEVQDSFDLSGFNLVIHEVAHKLDVRSGGIATGVPAISLRDIASWEQHLHAAMDALQEEIDLVGEDAASMDPYAAQDPVECFAVLSEYFFSAPELLSERFPALYQCFQGFYHQDPLGRLKDWQDSTHYNAPVIY